LESQQRQRIDTTSIGSDAEGSQRDFDFYIDLISATEDRRDQIIETITITTQLAIQARAWSSKNGVAAEL
jgi:hypothetical protein